VDELVQNQKRVYLDAIFGFDATETSESEGK
jgi:hypothetical protein